MYPKFPSADPLFDGVHWCDTVDLRNTSAKIRSSLFRRTRDATGTGLEFALVQRYRAKWRKRKSQAGQMRGRP